MHMDSCMRAYATVQKLLCHGSYCELILSLARASCRMSFAARPPAGSTKSVLQRCSLKKSVQIHASSWRGRCCGVAQESFNHLRWCRPHPVCLLVALALGHRVYPSQRWIFAIFRASFNFATGLQRICDEGERRGRFLIPRKVSFGLGLEAGQVGAKPQYQVPTNKVPPLSLPSSATYEVFGAIGHSILRPLDLVFIYIYIYIYIYI